MRFSAFKAYPPGHGSATEQQRRLPCCRDVNMTSNIPTPASLVVNLRAYVRKKDIVWRILENGRHSTFVQPNNCDLAGCVGMLRLTHSTADSSSVQARDLALFRKDPRQRTKDKGCCKTKSSGKFHTRSMLISACQGRPETFSAPRLHNKGLTDPLLRGDQAFVHFSLENQMLCNRDKQLDQGRLMPIN